MSSDWKKSTGAHFRLHLRADHEPDDPQGSSAEDAGAAWMAAALALPGGAGRGSGVCVFPGDGGPAVGGGAGIANRGDAVPDRRLRATGAAVAAGADLQRRRIDHREGAAHAGGSADLAADDEPDLVGQVRGVAAVLVAAAGDQPAGDEPGIRL